ncbi:PadR family transcriptional regulator [Cytobacillus purgationiresistens]|uniref:DNA-binding PadR family transcriptional regulator n=1 Tax=Cytobacillus purgationiresistens TaxID=863449 RepID=A0ABU0ANT3_9BACI|nr:PadR family transcriptional regulator [Cytobacillus purgationiresistens]MDQ0272953.1 DNA-binding PadR family transcriptional regulator [Cytobacillus purgationiresistens]
MQLKKGLLEIVILLQIKKRAMYGYELTICMKDIPFLNLTNGAIYPILKRLEKEKWIISYWNESSEGPRRKYYQITMEGERIIAERWEIYNSMFKTIESIVMEEKSKW